MARRISRMRLEADDWISVAALVSEDAVTPVSVQNDQLIIEIS